MKNILKALILAALLALPAGNSFADSGSKTTPCYTVGKTINVDSGCTLNIKSGGTLSLATGSTETNQATKTSGGSTDVSGIVFSTNTTGNPLLQDTVQDILVSNVNATGGYALISGVTGLKIFPAGLTVMVSGTAATATRLMVICTSGNVLASIPIANLIDKTPISPLGSIAANPGVAFDRGCASGDSVLVSNVGSNMATTTDVFVNMPYTMQ